MKRREFIEKFGVGAAALYPLLKSQISLGQTAQAKPPVRVLVVALQHGWGRTSGTFSGTESNFTIPSPLDVFEEIKNQCVFVDGLRTSFWGNAHDVSYSDILTCSVRFEDVRSASLGGPFPHPRSPSLDWMIGDFHKKDVLRLSLNYRSWGAPFHPLSFDRDLNRLAFFTSPSQAYRSFVEPLKAQQLAITNGDLSQIYKQQSSRSIVESLKKLNARVRATRNLGAEGRKVQSYLSSVEALGQRIIASESPDLSQIVLPEMPQTNLAYSMALDRYLEMITLAFRLDTHRVAVLGLGQGATNWAWTDNQGVPQVGDSMFASEGFHHAVAHYTDYSRDCFDGWVRWYGRKVIDLVRTLEGIRESDGTSLMDNTVIVLTGEVGNGQHQRRRSDFVVIGGGGGQIQRGRWLSLPTFEPRSRQGFFWGTRGPGDELVESRINYGSPVARHHAADLWVAVAQIAGLPIETFGIDVYNQGPLRLRG